ncbi:MAG: N-acetyltransferase [Boseongicola sp.]|nr:N-acetyltransferase [Boseongicola sp.]NNL73699.1 N-acetyltransferase [Silicimonas sp.]
MLPAFPAETGSRKVELQRETPEDWWEVEALYDLCFAPGRTALSSYRLRDGVQTVSELSLVARDELGLVAGAIRYWPVRVGQAPTLLLGPVAVHPTHQGEGIGGLLIEGSLARANGWDRVLLVGDAPYYGRFGFAPVRGVEMPPPTNPDRVLGRALVDGAWDGITGQVGKYTVTSERT